MNRFWGLVFLLVPLLGTVIYAMAMLGWAPLEGLKLPENYNLAGERIDHLYNVIHWIGGIAFVLTGLVLGVSIWKFGAPTTNKAHYISHHAGMEILWSAAAAVILVFLAFYQLDSWAENKLNWPTDSKSQTAAAPLVKVVAKRFGWEFFHAGADGKLDTQDDIFIENELDLPCGEDVVLRLESRDVIHSFFVPGLRLKQDVVPGLTQHVWFRATQPVELEIVCAELCGWGHYTMQARLKLHTRPDYERWLQEHSIWREFAHEESP